MKVVRATAVTLAFMLQIAMVGAFGYWGFARSGRGLYGIAVGVVVMVSVVTLWGALLAPRAQYRLELPWRLLAEAAVMALATIGLWEMGQEAWAATFGFVVVVRFALGFAADTDRVN
jgi:hypothetical protein